MTLTKSQYFFKNPKGKIMNENINQNNNVKDLATEAAVLSLVAEDTAPCKDQDKACIKRWLESQSDCA